MRYIPRRTKVKMEFYKGITFADIIYLAIAVAVLLLLILSSGFATDMKIYLSMAWLAFSISFFIKIADDKRMYETLGILFKFFARQKKYSKHAMRKHQPIENIIPYRDIANDMIDYKDYFAVVIEVKPIQFWLLNPDKQDMVINSFANALRTLTVGQGASLVKVAKPMLLDGFIYNEDRKYDEVMELANDKVMTRDEFDARSVIFESRMQDLRDLSNYEVTYMDHYYIVIYDRDRDGLTTAANNMISAFSRSVVPMHASRLKDQELAIFLKANYGQNIDENELSLIPMDEYVQWTMPDEIQFKTSKTVIDKVAYRNFSIIDYPLDVPNAWAVPFFEMANTKVVVNLTPLQKDKAERVIDRSIVEIEARMNSTFKSSKTIDLQTQDQTLKDLMSDLKVGNEDLYDVRVHIMCQEAMKKDVRTVLKQNGFKYSEMFGRQVDAFISTNLSKLDTVSEASRNIQTTSVAAMFPFISDTLQDEKGFYLGNNGSPVFVDFFVNSDKENPLHNERVNANMIVIGKSGSGKSYATST